MRTPFVTEFDMQNVGLS